MPDNLHTSVRSALNVSRAPCNKQHVLRLDTDCRKNSLVCLLDRFVEPTFLSGDHGVKFEPFSTAIADRHLDSMSGKVSEPLRTVRDNGELIPFLSQVS
ncbi:hypothetical protein RRF57_010006 [Xylaria bambusicola]|uniref:Uncharacterized protein n=1 Tax=Xylaria bambusicola TaxID=326684 RepID=A0AAN7Z894_9PEZI